MELNVTAYLGLLLVVALLRIYELQISQRHQREMMQHGASSDQMEMMKRMPKDNFDSMDDVMAMAKQTMKMS